jgi:hypothetical protein
MNDDNTNYVCHNPEYVEHEHKQNADQREPSLGIPVILTISVVNFKLINRDIEHVSNEHN